MDYTILFSTISAIVSLAGTALGAYHGQKLTAYRIQKLEEKVDKHNNFAERMPVLEEQIKTIEYRINAIERK